MIARALANDGENNWNTFNNQINTTDASIILRVTENTWKMLREVTFYVNIDKLDGGHLTWFFRFC